MENLLWLIPALPLAGFLILTFFGKKLPRFGVASVGVGSVALSAVMSIWLFVSFLTSRPASGTYIQHLWTWLSVDNFQAEVTLYADALSLVFVFVITFIGALIHLYSVEFMAADKDYSRFFACMNLFVCSMLILVLADNLLLLYLGWEGVGLCSYLLIGFWYESPENGYAARKAFIITRIGDTAMMVALFILFYQFGTLKISDILTLAPTTWSAGSSICTITALLLLGGAVGKSAQLPLQTWLPDAMAGPSPVSALIHAATMVTAGVYLIARMHTVFALSDISQTVVIIIGAATLLIAGFSALSQYDIKKVLAYSTMSQIGYMFLALGLGAWSAAIFHFMVHAFFKALLFLAAGAVIEVLHHEHNMFKMGGLKNKIPLIFWTFVIGSAALVALPLVTAGFYSKEQILWYSLSAERGNTLLWLIALTGAFITSLYTTRMLLITFFGEAKTQMGHLPGRLMTVPLVILSFFSITAGFIELPHSLGHLTLFSDFLTSGLPATEMKAEPVAELTAQILAPLVTLLGIAGGYKLYYPRKLGEEQPALSPMKTFWLKGWGFDAFYNLIFVRPVVFFAAVNKHDLVDALYTGVASACNSINRAFSFTQSGSLRWYLIGLTAGSILILTLEIIL